MLPSLAPTLSSSTVREPNSRIWRWIGECWPVSAERRGIGAASRLMMSYALLEALAAEADKASLGARVLLVAPTRGEGREILRSLARHRSEWVGLEVTTVKPLALGLMGAELVEQGLALLDEFGEQALIDELLDEVLGMTPNSGHLKVLAEGAGFRTAVREAISAVRMAGVEARRLDSARFGDSAKCQFLATVLRRFERRLATGRVLDTAQVLVRAEEAVCGGAPLGADVILLVPGLCTRGVEGRLVAALEERGARRLPNEPVHGLPTPEGVLWQEADSPPGPLGALYDSACQPVAEPTRVTLFRAAGITEELREVLRRVVARGLCWDDVEVVTTDASIYGSALHALATRLNVPVTFAVGLPVQRTRVGRGVSAWLRWIQEDFPEHVLRRLLESGDLLAPPAFRDIDAPALARRLRRLRIGWGRDRYLAVIEATRTRIAASTPRVSEQESGGEARTYQARALRELDALRALIGPIECSVPPIPSRIDASPVAVAPGELARALTVFLDHLVVGSPLDETAAERIRHILERVATTLVRPTDFTLAVATLTEHLNIRVPAPHAEGRPPWGSAGGHLHLADVEHGGWTGRPVTFVVGLDSARCPGPVTQHPILSDGERDRLPPRGLPTSAELLDERRFRMTALLARLRGEVTLSYPAWEPLEGRTLSPSSLMLRAYRKVEARPDAGFEDMERALGDPISRIPCGSRRLDREDVWLGALCRSGKLMDGEAAVRACFPWLAAGLDAHAKRTGETAGNHHGVVTPRLGLDPRADDAVVLSSSRLETLGSCPLRYYYAYVLGVRPADDPSFDPERWLDPLHKGSLLHAVYDRVLREAKRERIELANERFLGHALIVLEEETEKMRLEIPPPSRVAYEREVDGLREEIMSFVGMVREDLPNWEATELRFGFDDTACPAVELTLPSGNVIRLRGAIDRVDVLPSGGLRVVDYKTGSPSRFSTTTVWNHGRRLQHLLYAEAAERLLRRPVDRMEYHFPTRKGKNERSCFSREELRDGLTLLDHMLNVVAAGHFVPTDDAADCRFCDFRDACRVQDGTHGKTESPFADWARQRQSDPAYAELQLVRQFPTRSGNGL